MFRLPRSFAVLMLLLIALVAILPNASAEKLRAAFGGICPADEGERRLALLKQHGFNAALVCDSGVDVKIPLWKEWARLARQYDLRLFPIYTFAGTAEIQAWRGSFTPYAPPDGTQREQTPCPLDAEYWEKSVAERWEALALLSRLIPLAGIVIDTEMYGGGLAVYEQSCVCDQCWQEFAFALAAANPAEAATRELPKVSAMQRDQYLKEQRLWPQYLEIQGRRLQTIAAQIERRIHGVNPALTLGVMAYVDSWFYRNLIKGLGTSTQPVIVFSETFYIRGYSPDVLTEQTTIKQDGVARYLPGLWQGRFFPDDLPAQASQFAQQADGFWFFTADSLWTEKPKSGHYALHGTPADYWAAWDKANAMIQADQRESFFPSSVYEPDAQRLQTPPLLKDLLRNLVAEPALASNAPDIVYAEETLFHLAPQPGGVIRLMPEESAGQTEAITYRLFDETGTLAQAGECSNTTEIALPPTASGMMSLLISPGKRGARLAFDRLLWVVEASVTFPLATRSSPLTMRYAALPEQTHIRFKITYGATLFSVISPEGVERHRLQFQDFGEIRFPIDGIVQKQRQEFWKMTINSSDSTTRWHYFYQTPLPYLMP